MMKELLRLKDDCRADSLTVRIEDGIVRITAIRSNTRLSVAIPEEALRLSSLPPYEMVKRLMHEFTDPGQEERSSGTYRE